MSGGSPDYFYNRVTDVADQISSRASTPLHRAFATHLHKVATALHDLEWVWSDDTAPGDEEEAILAVIGPAGVLEQCVADAERALADLLAATGPSLSNAFRMRLKRVEAEKALPIEPFVPTTETQAAAEEARRGEGMKFSSVSDLMKDSNADDPAAQRNT